MKLQIVIFILLFVHSFCLAFNNTNVKLEIKVKEIKEQHILCDFLYSFDFERNDAIDYYALSLPFEENKDLEFSFLTNEPNHYFTYGFRNASNGVALINSLKKSLDFRVDFSDVQLPLKESVSQENGLVVNLNLFPDISPYPFQSEKCKYLSLQSIVIQYKSLLDSKPKFELDDRGSGFYKIELTELDKSIFFVLPIPPESYLGTFFAFLFIAIFIGVVGAIKLIEGKNQSIIGLIVSVLILGFLSYLFYQKVIPTDFNKDIDMISLIGGGIGLAIGIFLNSVYNLISINAIEKQQGG